MQGQIVSFDTEAGTGVILGDDGRRHGFAAGAWKGVNPPQPFQRVDYLSEDGRVGEVVPFHDSRLIAGGPAGANSSRLLGALGIGALVLGFVIPLVPMIAAMVLGLIAVQIGKRHGDRTGIVLGRVAWIGAVVILALAVALIAVGLNFLMGTLVPMFEQSLRPAPGLAV